MIGTIAKYNDITSYEKLREVWRMDREHTEELLDGVKAIDSRRAEEEEGRKAA